MTFWNGTDAMIQGQLLLSIMLVNVVVLRVHIRMTMKEESLRRTYNGGMLLCKNVPSLTNGTFICTFTMIMTLRDRTNM